MNCIPQKSNWRFFTALLVVICVAALLVHSAPTHHAAIGGFLLLPVTLFGLILLPHSLWLSTVLDQRLSLPVLRRTSLFQRPPPSRKK